MRILVTGVGAVTPLGLSMSQSWKGLLGGHSGVRRIVSFDASSYETRIAAEIQPYTLRSQWRSRMVNPLHRKTMFLIDAAEEALAAARIQLHDRALRQACVLLGSEVSTPDLQRLGRDVAAGEAAASRYQESGAHLSAAALAERLEVEGSVLTVSMACASSAAALAHAVDYIRSGSHPLVIAGGADAGVDPVELLAFSQLGALSTRNEHPAEASRPFDSARDGFVMGEGAAVLVLESEEHARSRGAPVLAELTGYGLSANAYRITDSPPDGRGPSEAMDAALADARIRPREVQYINAHGTSTLDNDASEAAAIRRTLGCAASQVPVSSTKSSTGHLLAAAGALEAAFTVLAVQQSRLPYTLNLDSPDQQCELRHITGRPLRTAVRHALSNSFAFGGANVSLVISRVDGAA